MPNFIADYLEYSKGNEAHENYHLWSGLLCLAAIMSRRVWLDFDYFTIKPNLYVVLLGPPGAKKNTAIDLCTDMLHKVNGDDPNLIPFAADSGTKEKIVGELGDNQRKFILPDGTEKIHAPLNIFVTELSQFLGTQTAAHMLDFLTTIWSQDKYVRSTNLHGRKVIQGPCVNMLAATVPDWITSYLKTDVITGGFSRRVVFVYEMEEGEPVPFPVITNAAKEAYVRCVARGLELLKVSGPFKWSDDAKEFYGPWYINHQKNIPKDPTLQFYYRTRWVQIVKVAMLLNLAKSDELTLQKDSLLASIAIFEKTEVNLHRVFQGMGRNELSAVSNKVIELLAANNGPMLEKKVKTVLFAHAQGKELWEIMEHLIESEKIFRIKEKSGEVERTWLYLPEHLAEAKLSGRLQ